MGKLDDWLKANTKQDANLAELQAILDEVNPLKMIKTREEAQALIESNDLLKAARDYQITSIVQRHDEKFMAEKFPELIKAERDKLMLELNPEETEAEKRTREALEMAQKSQQETDNLRLELQLQKKAQALGIRDPDIGRYVIMGESGLEKIESDHKKYQADVEREVKSRIQEKYGSSSIEPAQSEESAAKNTITRERFQSLSPAEQMAAMKQGQQVVD